MIKVRARPTVCQKLLPKEPAMELNARAKPSTSPGISVEPVKEPMLYRSIQPTMTEYPMARAREPKTGT